MGTTFSFWIGENEHAIIQDLGIPKKEVWRKTRTRKGFQVEMSVSLSFTDFNVYTNLQVFFKRRF